MNISKITTKLFTVSAFAGALICGTAKSYSQHYVEQDKIELSSKVPPQGSDEYRFLKNAPKPEIIYLGEERKARFVVTLNDNRLYHYDDYGEPIKVYSVASGKPSSPTSTGVRMVSHVESYPYLTAPRSTKRRRSPRSYGPKIIILDKIDLLTGEKSMIGEFIHGNNDSTSIGKKVSMGCIRMDNKVIKYLSGVVKRGDFVVIKK